jgi:hypothetical protein
MQRPAYFPPGQGLIGGAGLGTGSVTRHLHHSVKRRVYRLDTPQMGLYHLYG